MESVILVIMGQAFKLSGLACCARYLDLAQRFGLPLATMDMTLSKAAGRCGLPVLDIRRESGVC